MAVTGPVVILACILALVEFEHRAGPYDLVLEPVVVEVDAEGTYHATAGSTSAGLCLFPPCDARTTIELRFRGLPTVPYEARLEGTTTIHLGGLLYEDGEHVLRWSQATDHTDKDRLVLLVADQPAASLEVGPSAEPMRLDGPVRAAWPVPAAAVHLNEIGGFTISTVVRAELDHAPPDGWSYRAWLEGSEGRIDLGALDHGPMDAVLDVRVERVGLEHQDAVVIGMGREGNPASFPLLHASL